jgi:hypothetical protein
LPACGTFDQDEVELVGEKPVVVIALANYADLLKVMRRTRQRTAERRVVTEAWTTQANPMSTTTTTLYDLRRFCRISGSVVAATDIFAANFAQAYIALGHTEVRKRDENSLPSTATSQDAGTNC